MKVFLSFVFLTIVFSIRLGAQTPGLYDTWISSAPLKNPVIKISPDKFEITDEIRYNSFPSALLPRAEDLDSSHAIRSSHQPKVIDILKVTYDSGTAKGRIFFQRGKYSGIACLKFCLFDNGTIVLGGTIIGNGSFKTLEEAEAASLHSTGGYEYSTLNNTKRIAMFATLKDPSLMSEDEALKMIGSFSERATKIITNYFASSPSERNKFISSFSKIPIETAIGQRLISDTFIEYGYNPLRLPEAVSKFSHTAKVREALDNCDKDFAKLLRPFTNPPENEKPKAIVKLAPDLIPPDGQGGSGVPPPPMPVGEGGNSNFPATIPKDDRERDPEPDEFIAVTEEAKPLHDLQATVEYPELARTNKIEGKVTFMALIDRIGRVVKINIVQSDNKIFDQAVIDIVKATMFSPAKQNKVPVTTWFTSVIKFKLNDIKR